MSSFFKKLKNLTNLEEETEENIEEESFPKGLESEGVKEDKSSSSPFAVAREGEKTSSFLPPRSARESKKSEQSKKKERKSKKLIVEEKLAESPKIERIKKTDEEMKIQEKIEERKWPEPEGQLAVDVYQTNGELVIQSTIAGVKPEDLDITAQGDMVTIRGKRENIEKEEKNYFYQECYWGPFSREIILPVEADASRAEATMIDGILTIRMPKIEKEKKKKITVK